MAIYRGEDGRLLVQLLRAVLGWDQRTLAEAAGLAPASISRYESGETISPDALARIAAAVGPSLPWVERRLLPLARAAREQANAVAAGAAWSARGSSAPDLAAEGDAALEGGLRAAIDAVSAQLEVAIAVAQDMALAPKPPAATDREDATRAWNRIAPFTSAERLWLVQQGAELQTWALAEKLCEESVRLAPRCAADALDLAHLAVAVAQLVPGEDSSRLRVQGYAHAFVGNARRVSGDLVAASTEFATAWELWRAGHQSAISFLEEWRLFDLEASLRRDAEQFQAALELLDRAIDMAPPDAKGRILLKRAFTLELSGDAAGAIATLQIAAPLISESNDPRLRLILEFNMGVAQCHFGQYDRVEPQLPHLRQLALDLGNASDLMRVDWLAGRVAAACGRQDEACAAFRQVQAQFVAEGQPVGTAIVSLDLALLYLEQGRTADVRDLAAGMAWILKSRGVQRDALVALCLFCEAAKREAATLDQVRQALLALKHRALPALSIST